jgi:outer membrane protein OmpA-like peptidoglycan-associated protein
MAISRRKGEKTMKKTIVAAIFVLLAAALFLNAQEAKKTYNLQKAYVFLEEELLVNDTDLNCSYFIRDKVPRDIRIVGKHTPASQLESFTDSDELVIDSGAKDGLKEGDMLLILSEGDVIHHPRNHDRLGRFFFKKSLARISCLYDNQAIIRLQNGCQPIHVGDFALPYTPEATVFAKRIDYKYCRIPANAVTGQIVHTNLAMGIPADMVGDQQYLTVDLGEGVVGKGTFLLFYRLVTSDLPPMIIGLGIVIHSENTNATVKVLDAGTDMRVGDRALVLPRDAASAKPGQPGQAGGEELPVVETLPEGEEAAGEAPVAGAALNYSILFPFDGVAPLADPSADFAAIRDFVAGKSEYLVTLRGYSCSIGGEEYNLRLSSKRVEAIKGMLVSQYGIDPGRIESFFYGEKEPQFDNSTEAERRKNRLVKIEVNGK